MFTATELFKFLTKREEDLKKFLKRHALDDEPADEEPPPKPRPMPKGTPGSMEWYQSLPPPRSDPRDVSMNQLARFVPKLQRPRGPGHQLSVK